MRLKEYKSSNDRYKLMCKEKKSSNDKEENNFNHIRDSRTFWEAIKGCRPEQVNDHISKEDWIRHYSETFNDDKEETKIKIVDRLDENIDSEINEQEVTFAKKNLKSKKAPGIDQIPNEIWKDSPPRATKLMTSLFNNCYNAGKIPISWCESVITPIFKKRCESLPTIYRSISLLPTILKLFTTILSFRLRNFLDNSEEFDEYQAGFRPNKSCQKHIFCLNSILQSRLRRKGNKLYACFFDFSQAFNSAPHSRLWQKMHQIGLSSKFIQLVKAIYENSTACVKTVDGETEKLQIKKGAPQKESLSPSLFNIYINDLISKFYSAGLIGVSMGCRIKHAVIYADDVVLLSHNRTNLQQKLNILSEFALENKMKVNLTKTKNCYFPKRRQNREKRCIFLQQKSCRCCPFLHISWCSLPNNWNFQRSRWTFSSKRLCSCRCCNK